MKKTQIYSIVFGCPKCRISYGYASNNRDKNCPLIEIDKFSSIEKMNWIDELSEEKVVSILAHHAECTKSN